MTSLAGRTAVVTGSTSGIGRAIAGSLAGAGANVVLNGFGDAEDIEAIRVGLEADHGIRAFHDGADMTKPAEITRMVETAGSTFGAVDILVNNAGIQHAAPVDELPPDRWDAIIAINLSAAFHTTRAALPGMKARGWGRIVNLASAHALVASPFKSAYVAAKHGMLGLTRTVALETAQSGITCNAICPGFVRTPLVEAQIPNVARASGVAEEDVVRDVLLASQPTRRFVGVDEIGALAVFLCSDAAQSITGAALPIDGGWTAQ